MASGAQHYHSATPGSHTVQLPSSLLSLVASLAFPLTPSCPSYLSFSSILREIQRKSNLHSAKQYSRAAPGTQTVSFSWFSLLEEKETQRTHVQILNILH